MRVDLLRYPTEEDWMECKRRALVTVGLRPVTPPDFQWRHKILRARHSPIRYLMFSFYMEIPYWTSVHYCRHVHAQPYVKSQRNDRQQEYDRNAARQDAPVQMILDLNAESLMTVLSKRLCGKADPATREVALAMRALVYKRCPEFRNLLVPDCEITGSCREMYPCGRWGDPTE